MKIDTKQILFASLAVLIVIGGLALYQETVGAAEEEIQLSGYLWSSNIGWVSLSGQHGGNVKAVNVGESYELQGYGWSKNIGWIKFNPESGYPSGNGTTPSYALIDRSNGELSGWIRACSVFANPSSCSGTLADNTKRGGWDGWISLRGNGYGVSWLGDDKENGVGGNFDGFAWGHLVTGWVDWSHVIFGADNTLRCTPSGTIPGVVTAVASGGNPSNYEWSGPNVSDNSCDFGSSSCVITVTQGFPTTYIDVTDGSQTATCNWTAVTDNTAIINLQILRKGTSPQPIEDQPGLVSLVGGGSYPNSQDNCVPYCTIPIVTPSSGVLSAQNLGPYSFAEWGGDYCYGNTPSCSLSSLIAGRTYTVVAYFDGPSDEFTAEFGNCADTVDLSNLDYDCEEDETVCVATANRRNDGSAISTAISVIVRNVADSLDNTNNINVNFDPDSLPRSGVTGIAQPSIVGLPADLTPGGSRSWTMNFPNTGKVNQNESALYTGLNVYYLNLSRGSASHTYCAAVRYIDDVVAPR